MSTPPPKLTSTGEPRDPFDGDYIGNIFGWKVSLIGLGVILFFVGVLVYRTYALDVPIGFDDPLQSESEKAKFAPPGKADTLTVTKD
ncbi:hypothetical protein [Neolewinella antarctica]|uniref:Nitrogen fixation protein FixH n=1 Tax=Neolewinella antarctica TaxID=442734 RepID=A0ABX0X6X5_9BACT|nr:hypothetical protein [Neolewinella antarctica]NJC24749.1 hypothetical protein [Neolewinella antarctica]